MAASYSNAFRVQCFCCEETHTACTLRTMLHERLNDVENLSLLESAVKEIIRYRELERKRMRKRREQHEKATFEKNPFTILFLRRSLLLKGNFSRNPFITFASRVLTKTVVLIIFNWGQFPTSLKRKYRRDQHGGRAVYHFKMHR